MAVVLVVRTHPTLDDERVAHAIHHRRYVVHAFRMKDDGISDGEIVVADGAAALPREEGAALKGARVRERQLSVRVEPMSRCSGSSSAPPIRYVWNSMHRVPNCSPSACRLRTADSTLRLQETHTWAGLHGQAQNEEAAQLSVRATR